MVLGLGTDIVEISRVREMVERHGDHFTDRCFTAREVEWAKRFRDSAIRFAGRWAAKEAVVKALGTGFVRGISFHDIEVLPLPSGQPVVELTGGARDLAESQGITEIRISISHSENYAVATAIATGDRKSK